MNKNQAPFPHELEDVVRTFKYRPGWTCSLASIDRGQGSEGLTLDIVTLGYNAYHPERGQTYRVHHYMIVPAASYDRRAWQRWLLDQHILVDTHEACEFASYDGKHLYAPNHGPGRNPYVITEVGSAEDAATSFRGDTR